jgi:hypothetical protein
MIAQACEASVIDARSAGMAGIGVSYSPNKSAAFFNPALLGRHQDKRKFSLQLITLGIKNFNAKQMTDDAIVAFEAIEAFANTLGTSEADTAVQTLATLKEDQFAAAALNIGLNASHQNSILSFSFSLSNQNETLIYEDILPEELDSSYILTSTDIKSRAFTLYNSYSEFNFSFGRKINFISKNFYMGVALKYHEVRVNSYILDKNTGEVNNVSELISSLYNDAEMTRNFNYDIGFLYSNSNQLSFALLLSNLIEKNYPIQPNGILTATYVQKPQAKLGISYAVNYLNYGFDLDLNPNKKFENLTGTLTPIDPALDDEQFIRFGIEGNIHNILLIRSGVSYNLASQLKSKLTISAGAGLALGALELDIAVEAHDNQNYNLTTALALDF